MVAKMKLILIIAISIANVNSQSTATEYAPSVPQLIASVFSTAGTPCVTDTECDDLFEIPSNMTAFWTCMNETDVIQSDNTTTDLSFCQFNGCDSDGDCGTDEICYTVNQCDDNDIFYDESYLAYSTICYADTLCDGIKTQQLWTTDTVCFVGEDGNTYYSEEEAVICGDGATGTCPMSSDVCKAATDCKSDKTCCTKGGWDESQCFELLFTEYIIYTSIVLAVLLLCFCGCCCCIYKARKRRQTYDEMDNQTNHYNVYI